MLMYNCGIKNIYDPDVFKMCERDIEKYRNSLDIRLIFGGLYGALKTNAASPFLLDFFLTELHEALNRKEEVKRNIDEDEAEIQAELDKVAAAEGTKIDESIKEQLSK